MSSSCVLCLLLLLIIWCSLEFVSSQKSTLSGTARILRLEKLFSANHTTDELEARDRTRHAWILRSSTISGVTVFPLMGSFDPKIVGIYYTTIKLGSPPKKYNMMIDTGSEISWISCSSCTNCPRTSGLGVEMNFYDPDNSSTESVISCSASVCKCSNTNQCAYSVTYGDQSGTSGYYVSDLLQLDTIVRTSLVANYSTPIIFGCSTSQVGGLTMADIAVDGIIGLDRRRLSIISQLSSHRVSPKTFSHCLKGEGGTGGILVFCEILNPSMVYTPLVPSKGLYNVYLESVTVGEKLLSIDPTVFATSDDRGTFIDSGTTLVYLVAEAYDSVINAITAATSSSAKSILSGETACYLVSSSFSNNATKIFPQVTLHFAGGASMDLRPTDYLDYMGVFENTSQWCIPFIQKDPSLTILGEFALKDKSVVYDLARQRIGWADYNCSLPVNVSISSGTDQVINAKSLFHVLESMLFIYLFWN